MQDEQVTLSKNEIIDLALRYISPEEITDFPYNSDLFCLLIRTLPENRILNDEEGWAFNGYGVCTGYSFDEKVKPPGKWLWMHFASLATFPPVAQVLKLQPPHVIKGRFQSVDRTHEIRIVKVAIASTGKPDTGTGKQKKNTVKKKKGGNSKGSVRTDNIVAFRAKKRS